MTVGVAKLRSIFALTLLFGSPYHLGAQGIEGDLDRAAALIKKRAVVGDDILVRDRMVIDRVYPEIRADYFKKGFTGADASAAAASGWTHFYLAPHQTGPFSAEVFKTHVGKLGKVRIESEPPDARIQINSMRLEESTNTTRWLQPGTYNVVLTKSGFVPEEARLQVVEGSNPTFKRSLKPRIK